MASKKLHRLLLSTIPLGSSILYIGCSNGDVLNSLNPKYGFGIDSQKEFIEQAKRKYIHLDFSYEDITKIELNKKFDFIVIDDFIPYLEDVFLAFKKIRELCKENSKIIMTTVPPLIMFRSMINLLRSKDQRAKNWIPKNLLDTLLYLSDFLPRPAINSIIIADVIERKKKRKYSYSIVIPAYNEEGNIEDCIKRIPDFDMDYEIIVVNDGSKDKTAEIVKGVMKTNQRLRLVNYEKNGGKGYATRRGFDAANKEILIILDADMTVKPEDLPLFIEPLESRKAEFVMGTRMVYPINNRAMGLVNMIGNKMFSIIFSYLLNQNVTDTLCGTKCMFKKDYERMIIKDNAWPDFDHLFGASKLNLKIVEIPIHYQVRVAGESKMKILKHGLMLLKASMRGLVELKLKW